MLWTHPRKPWLRLRRKVCAVLAVIQMGIRDHARIAVAVGLTADEVAEIDAAEDEAIRELVLEGIPAGEFFALAKEIRCPICGGRLTLAPCVTCQTRPYPPPCDDSARQQLETHDRRGTIPRCGNMPRADQREDSSVRRHARLA